MSEQPTYHRPLVAGFMGFYKLGPLQKLDPPWTPPKPVLSQIFEQLEAAKAKPKAGK